jgi:hypothetical protein
MTRYQSTTKTGRTLNPQDTKHLLYKRQLLGGWRSRMIIHMTINPQETNEFIPSDSLWATNDTNNHTTSDNLHVANELLYKRLSTNDTSTLASTDHQLTISSLLVYTDLPLKFKFNAKIVHARYWFTLWYTMVSELIQDVNRFLKQLQ